MRASLKFTVWTIVVFSCIFEISQAQCNGTTCNSSVLFNTTTTTVNVLNCNLSEPLKHSSSISNLDPGTVHTVFANCFNCCLNATTKPEHVTNLTAESKTTSLSLKWKEPDGNVHSYNVKWTGGGRMNTLQISADVPNLTSGVEYNVPNLTSWVEYNVPNLTSGVEYTVSVVAVAKDGKTEGAEVTISQYTIPAKPVNITASQREPHSLNIGWTLPEGNADHYVVQLDQKENQTSALSLRFTGLSPGRLHTVSVTAVAGHLNNTSEPSTFATYPLPPGSIRVIQRTNSSLNLTWDVDPEMLDAPNINYSVAYEGGESELMAVMVSDIALTQLNSGTQYVIIVKTVGPEDLRSNGVNVSACTNPNPVLELTAYPESNTSVKVEWSYPQDYETKNYSYILTYNARGNNDSQTGNYTFVTGLEPGTRYTITVTTLLTTECKSTEEKVSTYTKPNPVSNLKVQFVNTSTITLNWASLIDYQPASSFFVQARQGLNVVHNDSTAAQSYTFNGLTPGQLYTFTVTTEVAGVRSDDETITAQLRPAVVNISEVTGSTTHLTVSWSEGEGKVDSYTVFLYNDTHLVQSKEDLSNSTRDTSFYDLTPGVRYCAEVSTKSGTLMNNSSRVCKSTWPAVVNISKVTGSTTNLTVSWSEAEGKVDTYTVLLYNDTHSLVQSKKDLNNSTLNASFTELKPGVKYCAAVVTKSGSLENKSSDLCNATFPNPPRNIRVESRTEQSLTFMWDAPEDMQPDQYNFIVTTHIGPNETKNYSLTLSELESGSPYNISIVTVGVKNYKSQEVRKQAYTKPYSVTDLRQTEITPNSVKLVWNQTAHKSDYTYFIEVSGGVNSTVTNFTHEVEGLISGTNYSFTVTTQAADGTPATPETVSFFTRPYGINALVADTINTTSINVTWEQPIEYQEVYKYLVEISGCSDPKNLTISNESMEIAGLTPGTNCSFCVTVRAANGIEGESNCTSQYTKPEKAQPHVSNQGSNSSLLVSWAKPPGNVEMYTVYLNFTETHLTTVRLNSSGRFHTFEGLPAGRLYTVVVETQSGSFSVPSESITNATYPNPPGAISILNKTTCSIHISWEEAPLMTGAHFYYRLEIPSKQVKNTTATNDTFNHLLSGTPYNISIVTVAAMGFESEAVWHNMVTTRPCSVSALLTEPSEENVTLHWSRPVAYKSTYRFIVTLVNSSGNILQAVKTEYSTHGFDKLDPGSSYYFTVTTVTSDATPAAPEKTSNCTDASAVEFNDCSAPNEPNAKITWFWEKPRGRSSSFTVKLGDTTEEVYEGFKFEKSNLTHYTNYTVEVTTQSCGKPSVTVTKTCQTGITKPPILQNYEFQIDKKFNMFTITMYRSLLDTRYGPITNVGVLLTTNTNTATASTQGLKTTYNQWKKEKTGAYLATVIDITDSDVKVNRHSTPVPLTIHVGDETTWNNYENGVLEPTTQYKFAIVLFTDLKIKSGLINVKESLFSATEFQGHVELPQNPVVIGLAVGLTLAIFLILLLLLIGFIFYWRRLSSKKSSDVQVKCKRNAPVRVEDYEVYYKKQKADSNCGFAAEYEDLKVVGNGLSKTNATNPELKSKNRYNNVLPYDSSRVKLSIINGNPLDDYINANYIPGYNSRKEFIAAQGPLPTTVNDFWRMIWEKNAHAIVMLTRCNEQGRVKCEQYWTSGTKHFGNITVTKTSEIPLDDWTIRDFDVKNVKTAETRLVRQFHFTAWPDHGVPETTELLISFRHLVREHMDQYRHSPTVVHCSAGVGRTGTFIAIDRLIFQIERENVVDVYSIVYDMRMHRVLMVQTEDQYVFLNQCALDIIRSRTGTNVDLIYQNMTAVPIYENIELQKRES